MWLDLLLILLAISPLMPSSLFRWQNPGSSADRKHEARLTAWPVSQ
jgi:hypothetical protein